MPPFSAFSYTTIPSSLTFSTHSLFLFFLPSLPISIQNFHNDKFWRCSCLAGRTGQQLCTQTSLSLEFLREGACFCSWQQGGGPVLPAFACVSVMWCYCTATTAHTLWGKHLILHFCTFLLPSFLPHSLTLTLTSLSLFCPFLLAFVPCAFCDWHGTGTSPTQGGHADLGRREEEKEGHACLPCPQAGRQQHTHTPLRTLHHSSELLLHSTTSYEMEKRQT